MQPHIAILAAGQGKRMHSKLPKVLHPILFRPMLHYVIDLAKQAPHSSVNLVVGHGEAAVREACASYEGLQYFVQKEQRGTAHAVQQLEGFLQENPGTLVILSGDVILLREDTLAALQTKHRESGAAATLLTAVLPVPQGYGRILRNSAGKAQGIREEADCAPVEKKISEVNCGIYVFETAPLLSALSRIGSGNKQNEFYLTDVVAIFVKEGLGVETVTLTDAREMTGINDRKALREVEAILQARNNDALMLKGVRLLHPESTFIDPLCRIAPDATIEGGTVIIDSEIAAGAHIEGGCRIVSSQVGSHSHIKQGCYLESSRVGSETTVGPYAHLRPGSVLGQHVKIGNFVEVKNSIFADGAKASHLSYVGDADVGKDVNIGCGFITCNYDGINKNRTIIEDGVFIGSDSQAVAPVRIGAGSYVASGTTVTEDVPADALAISRGKQVTKLGYASRLRAVQKSRAKKKSTIE